MNAPEPLKSRAICCDANRFATARRCDESKLLSTQQLSNSHRSADDFGQQMIWVYELLGILGSGDGFQIQINFCYGFNVLFYSARRRAKQNYVKNMRTNHFWT